MFHTGNTGNMYRYRMSIVQGEKIIMNQNTEQDKNYPKQEVEEMSRKLKGEVLKEFEKICPTETSFKRVRKDIHDVFDRVAKETLGRE